MPASLLALPANAPKYAGTRSPLWFGLSATPVTTPAELAQFQVVFTAPAGGSDTVIMDLGDVVVTMVAQVLPGTAGTTFGVALGISSQAAAFHLGVLKNYTLTQRYYITFAGVDRVQFVARTPGVAGNCALSGTAPVNLVVDYAGADAVLLPNYSCGLRIWESSAGSVLVTELYGEPDANGTIQWDVAPIVGADPFVQPDMPEYWMGGSSPMIHTKSTRPFWFQWWQRYGSPVVNWQVNDQYSELAPMFAVLAGHRREDAALYDSFIGQATSAIYPKPFLTYRQRYGKRITSPTEQHFLAFHTPPGLTADTVRMQARIHYTDPGGGSPVTGSWVTRYTDLGLLFTGYVSSWPTGYGQLNLAALLPAGKVMHWYEVQLVSASISPAVSETLRFYLEPADYNEQHILWWSSLGAPETLRCTGAWSVVAEGSNTERLRMLQLADRTDVTKSAYVTTPGTSQRSLRVNVISASQADHDAKLDLVNSPALQYVDHAHLRHLPLRLLSHTSTVEQRGTEDEHLYLLEFEFLLDDPQGLITELP